MEEKNPLFENEAVENAAENTEGIATEAVDAAEETIDAAADAAEDAEDEAEELAEDDVPELSKEVPHEEVSEYERRIREQVDRFASPYEKKEAPVTEEEELKKTKKKKGFFGKLLTALVCGVFFGAAAFGTLALGIHLTGYDEKIQSVLSAAEETRLLANTVANSTISKAETVSVVSEGANRVQAVYDSAISSVVSIYAVSTQTVNYGFFTREEESSGSGSGVIIGTNDTELLIVTNYHVVEGAKNLTVSFVDNQTVNAFIKGTDPDNDLAVIAVMLDSMDSSTKASISIATLANDSDVSVGEQVVAIGNALGYGQTLTVGYISAVGREVTIDGNTMTMLQTDAAINPGNSGGALLNMEGKVIGINSAKYSDTTVEGMGFAIPISLVYEIIDELSLKETKVAVSQEEMGYLGVTVTTLPADNAYGMPSGAYIKAISDGTPAAASGLREGDIITRVDDIVISSKEDLTEAMSYYRGGSVVTLKVERLVDGKYQEVLVEITLAFRKDFISG